MPIRVLPPDVAAKIAAGEVVERPVSVAKELLENAIDAGADDVQVEIVQGGRRMIRVIDNGCGIAASEVELALTRHATSKLRSAEDLQRIRTLGFRGEALASMAAVSRLTIHTRTADEEAATLYRIEGGVPSQRESQPRPRGTTVQVENLFFNTPARLKFLKSDATEAGHVARLVCSYALAYPEKRFALHHNDRLVVRTTGTGQLFDVIVAIYGLDVAEQMLEMEPREGQAGITVGGYISAPSLHRANRQDATFFVNRRWIQDNALTFAVTEAYRSLLPAGRYPVLVVNIDLSPEDVDVNIHPTKREVRFRQSGEVFGAVQKAVRTTLMAQHPVPSVATPPDWSSALRRQQMLSRTGPFTAAQTRMAMEVQRTGDVPPLERREPVAQPPLSDTVSVARLPMLRVLGQIAQTYIIAEGPGGMYLVDQHAAHERVRYEELRAQRKQAEVVSQELLDPLPVDLAPQQATLLGEHLETLSGYGFEIIPFGRTTFLVKRVPATLVDGDIAGAILEMIDAALEGGEGFSWEDQALITLSCHTAVRAGQTLSLEEMRDLVRQLERCDLPHTCPHGRPTIVHLSRDQLEKEFGRR